VVGRVRGWAGAAVVWDSGGVCGWAGGEWLWWRWVVAGRRHAWGGAGASMLSLSCSGMQQALLPASDLQGTLRVRMGMQQWTPSQAKYRKPKAQARRSLRVGHLSHGSTHFHDDERGDARGRQ
jgi:hypothetical protein